MRVPSPILAALLVLGGLAAAAVPGAAPAAGAEPLLPLEPTATCPREALDELNRTIEFVRGRSWTDEPGATPLSLAPDLKGCRVVLHVGQLSPEEEGALRAGAGNRLAIEYRKDWAKPSRLLLVLWVVFGGSGLGWLFWRYSRQ